jgi:replicative DNA helicase
MHRVDAVADGAPAVDTVATGFPSVDRVLGGGIRRGDLVVVGGDVGSGKSALLLAMSLRMAARGAPVSLYSGEMSTDRMLERALAVEGRVAVQAMRLGELDDQQRASVGAAAVRLREATPFLATIPRGGVTALREELLRRPEVPSVLMVDPLLALGAEGRTDPEVLAATVLALKLLALDLEVGVLLSAPVPGVQPGRADRRPTLDDFGAAGAIKDAADVVLALYREGMYDPGIGIDGATELLVRKHRNGATGYVDLYFFEQWMRFEDLLDPDR